MRIQSVLKSISVIGVSLFIQMNTTNLYAETPKSSTDQTHQYRTHWSYVAELEPKSDSDATGRVSFNLRNDRMRIDIRVESVTPGSHAMHVHENGDCSAPDAGSAGSHWDPLEAGHHGSPFDEKKHLGDFGNVLVRQDGIGVKSLSLPADERRPWKELLGKAVILHALQDDLSGQPSGNAGKRIACGVIEKPPLISKIQR